VKFGITLGDPSGISPEILVKGADKLPPATYIIYGALDPLHKAFQITGKRFPFQVVNSPEEATQEGFYLIPVSEGNYQIGKPSKMSAKASVKFLERGVSDAVAGKIDGLITLPISKDQVMSVGFPYAGHTDYLAEKSNTEDYLMLLACDKMKVALATTHIPLRKVPEAISQSLIKKKLYLLNRELKGKFKIKKPKIAVLGLNPHCGDNGQIGDEEIKVIQPVVDQLKREGLDLYGCLSPDTAFVDYKKYDAYLCMYHDQGLIPLKMLCFKKAVNITLGLPFIRTSPDHGTGFDIAGKNTADPSSFIEAVKSAVKLANPELT